MGYYSQFEGDVRFREELTQEQEERLRAFIKDALGTYSDIVYNEGECCYGDDGCALYPASYSMKGYDFNTDLLKIVRWCAANGYPALDGYFERVGEERGDFERIVVDGAKVFSQNGSVVYGERMEVKGE